MFVLSPKDVEIVSVQHPKRPKRVPILRYADKNFRLVSVFSIEQEDAAHASWRDLTDNKGKVCVLLEESVRYSLWSQVRIDKGLLVSTVPEAYLKACVVLIQFLHNQAQTLGDRQAKSLIAAFQVGASHQLQPVGGLESLLKINAPSLGNGSGALPRWKEDDLCALLLEIHRLGCKFFGRKKFVGPAISALDILPGNDKVLFLNWLQISLLGNLWLS